MQTAVLDDTAGGRSWVVVLDTGEEPKELLTRWAADNDVTAAQLTAIGAFERATLGWYDLDEQTYVDIEVDEQVEVLTLAGDISLSPDGEAFLHLHVTCGRRDGSTVGGHVQRAVVRPTLEVMVTETRSQLRRKHDKRSGLGLLDLEQLTGG